MKKLFALSLWTVILLNACDVLEEDVIPTGDEQLVTVAKAQIPSGTPYIMDLRSMIQVDEEVKFKIGQQPEKGKVNFFQSTFLLYEPKSDFESGLDQFSIELYNKADELLDTDTVTIEVIGSGTNFACSTGAISDFVDVEIGEIVEFSPLANDVLCDSLLNEFEFEIFLEPFFGELVAKGDYEFVYIPDSTYKGIDFMIYGLTILDGEEEQLSVALVQFNVGDQKPPRDCREDLFRSKDFEIDDDSTASSELYEVEIYFEQDDCSPGIWILDVTEVLFGQAEANSDGTYILYSPGEDADSVDYISYAVTFEDGLVLQREVYIFFDDLGGGTSCPEAWDDYYVYSTQPDSLSGDLTPFIFYPVENDGVCSEDYTLSIFRQPEIGFAEVTDDRGIIYSIDGTLEEDTEISIKYELCDNDQCKYAYAYLYLIGDGENCAEAYDDYYEFDVSEDSLTNGAYEIIIAPYTNDQYCSENFQIKLLQQPDVGEAEVIDGRNILYRLSDEPAEELEIKIKYELCDEGKCDYAYVYLHIYPEGSTECVDAEDDYYSYYAYPDSVSQEVPLFEFDPVENDSLCSADYTLEILQQPDLGSAVVNEDLWISYQTSEEFVGEKTTQLIYKVCVGDDCEDAVIQLTVYK